MRRGRGRSIRAAALSPFPEGVEESSNTARCAPMFQEFPRRENDEGKRSLSNGRSEEMFAVQGEQAFGANGKGRGDDVTILGWNEIDVRPDFIRTGNACNP